VGAYGFGVLKVVSTVESLEKVGVGEREIGIEARRTGFISLLLGSDPCGNFSWSV